MTVTPLFLCKTETSLTTSAFDSNYDISGSSSSRKTIIGIVGGLCFLFLIIASVLWFRFQKAKVAERGDKA